MSSEDSAQWRFTVRAGAKIGAYEIRGPLGSGAMGAVYRACDTRLGRDVALKILPPGETGTTARERVEREARIVASLNHPNVLALHDIGMHEGATYLVTEVVEGESLRGVKLPLRKSLEIAAQIADGLAAAHAAGVTHRDLKPDNVMVTHDGRVKLLDFGIATTTGLPADFEATSGPEQAGSITGTIGYMAPEQVRGNDVDSRADIFAFGAVLYELVSGDRAFQGETAADVMASVLRADPRELPGVPPPVRDIIYRCLEKKREQRFQSARDLSFALRQAAGVMAGSPESVTMNAASLPSPAAVREELAVLLGSPPLAGASRLCSLLRFIVEKTLQGEAAHLKETRIGLEVFGRKADSYDPAIDPIVRVQMGRLRFKLRAYYNGPGGEDRVRVEIPVGSYAPVFTAQVPANRVKEIVDTPPAALEDLRLAVLPIVNMSVDPDNQYFCDGLTEELISRLAQIPRLRVVARTSSFQFKDAARDIREVGRLLDVSKVLEGSVRKAANRIRVTVQLINVADGCHLWSERYEGELTDIFGIHEQISTAVQRALRTQILGQKPAAAPRSQPAAVESYNHYLQGRFLWKKRTEQGLRSALDHFEEAARLDPAFARALSGIADCHLMLALSAAEAPERSMPKAQQAAITALELDDSLAEAHASLAAVKNCYEWDLQAAEAGYKLAMSLDPSYATTLHWLGLLLHAAAGRFALAVDCHEQAIELDPLSPPIIADLALLHAFREDFTAAAMYCRRALELDPHFHRSFWFLGLTQAWSGDFAASEASLNRGLDLCEGAAFRSRLLGALGFVQGRAGKRQLAGDLKRELLKARETSYVPSFELAQIEIGLDNPAGALACLEDAVRGRESFAIFLKAWPTFRPLRSEPRFRALLAQIGLDS